MPGGLGTIRSRQAVYFSLVSPLGQNPDPKYKPYLHLKNHHDFESVIDREAAQASWNSTKQRTGVSYVTTHFRPSSSPRSSTPEMDRESTINKGNLRAPINRPRTTANESDGRNPKHCRDIFLRKTKTAKSTCNAPGEPETAESTVFLQMW